MTDRERATIEVEIERVPDIEGPEWYEWCRERGFDPLNGDRKAWIGECRTYLRGAAYLVYWQGMLIGPADASELVLHGGNAL